MATVTGEIAFREGTNFKLVIYRLSNLSQSDIQQVNDQFSKILAVDAHCVTQPTVVVTASITNTTLVYTAAASALNKDSLYVMVTGR